MKMRDLIILVAVGVFSFPVLYLSVMFATGGLKIVVNQKIPLVTPEPEDVKLMKYRKGMDSAAIHQSAQYGALEEERAAITSQKEALSRQQERVNLVTHELDSVRGLIEQERKSFEKSVAKVDTLEAKKIKDLAKIYGAMRPAEAARIIETLDLKLAEKIIASIGDERAKAKILGALTGETAKKLSTSLAKAK